MPTDGVFVGGIALTSFFGGLGLSLAIAKRRNPNVFKNSSGGNPPNDAARMAMRALGIGTVCAILGVGGIVLGIKYAFNIHNVSQVKDKAEHLVPKKLRISNRGTDKTD